MATSMNRSKGLLFALLCALLFSLVCNAYQAKSTDESFWDQVKVVDEDNLDIEEDSEHDMPVPTSLDTNVERNKILEKLVYDEDDSTTDSHDVDEFEELVTDSQQPTNEAVDESKNQTRSTFITFPQQEHYNYEIAAAIFVICFVVNYYYGKKENERIATEWVKKYHASIFIPQFSYIGNSGKGNNSPLIMKESNNKFLYYASGRIHCESLLATLELKRRHDLIAMLYGLFFPSDDLLTIDVVMNSGDMNNFILAIMPRSAKFTKNYMEDTQDLKLYGKTISQSLFENLTVVADCAEIVKNTKLFSDEVTSTIAQNSSQIVLIHFSDQTKMANNQSKKTLKFIFKITPNNLAKMDKLMEILIQFIDIVPKITLSAKGQELVEKMRKKVQEENQKALLQKQKEEAEKKKSEKLSSLSKEEQKLLQEKARKKEMSKKAPKVKVKVG